jgi:ATP-dependent protease HslVU (ClpYQ) peptidase subunit
MRDDGIYGIGSGSKYAIGALQAGADWNTALTIAEKNDIYTAQPFIYRSQVKV